MILLVNCFVTEDVFSTYDRGLLEKHGKFDIFRYMLKGMSHIPFDRVYVNYSLSEEYAYRDAELHDYIRMLFPLAQIKNRRLERYGEWLDFFEANRIIANEPVFLACNDDHIFLSEDAAYFEEVLAGYHALKSSSDLVSVWHCHWPELSRYIHQLGVVKSCDKYDAVLTRNTHDCLQMVSPELLYRWFYVESSHLDRNALVRRSEDLGPATGDVLAIYPRKEIFRHFDGYSHAGVSIRDCSPLTIPPGFFEQGIKLCFANLLCRAEAMELVSEGYVVCSPATVLAGNHVLPHPIYPYSEDNVPALWRDRIAEIIYRGAYQARFNQRCITELQAKASADPCHPHQYSVTVNMAGEYDFVRTSDDYPGMPYLGFHKTPAAPSPRSIFLLQDLRFFDRPAYINALETAMARIARLGVAVNLLLVTNSAPVLQGKLCYTLNMLLGQVHSAVASVVTLACTERLRPVDFFRVVDSIYGQTDFIVAHNADPVSALPRMLDIFEQGYPGFQGPTVPFCFVSAGVGNCFGGEARFFLSRTKYLQSALIPDGRSGEDIVEFMLLEMEKNNVGMHELKKI